MGECNQCLRRLFLRPVRVATPYGEGILQLCLWCRVNWRDEFTACLASTIKHAVISAAAPTKAGDET